jgi:hypothetical protein
MAAAASRRVLGKSLPISRAFSVSAPNLFSVARDYGSHGGHLLLEIPAYFQGNPRQNPYPRPQRHRYPEPSNKRGVTFVEIVFPSVVNLVDIVSRWGIRSG